MASEPNPSKENINYERIMFQSVMNEGQHVKSLQSRRLPLIYNEKDLREAAHAEVAHAHSVDADDDKGSRKRKNMDPDEKAKQSRDRNREHAKNTRLRKKAYVGKLKELVENMKQMNSVEDAERLLLGEKIHETHSVRKKALKLFLHYRANNVRDRSRWAELVDEAVVLVLPITPYRHFHRAEIKYSSRSVGGIDAVMADAASLTLMAESIGQPSAQWKEALKRNESCKIAFHCAPQDMLAAGDVVMCRYVMQIDGCTNVGGDLPSFSQQGMIQCRFDREDKILSVEMMFDVMGYMQQLQRAGGISPQNTIVPNTLDMALQPTTECQAIVDAHMPYPIQQVNGPWADVTGLPQAEATGMVLFQALRVYPFQNDLICRLASDCAAGRPGSAIVLVMEKEEGAEEGKDCAPGPLGDAPGSSWEASGSGNGGNGREIAPLVRYIKLLPLTSDSDRVTHFSATLVDIPLTAEETREAAASVTSMLSSNADGFSSLPSLSNSHNSHTSRNNSNSHNSHNSNDASTFTSSSDSPESEQFGQFYPQEAYFQQDQGQGQYKQARYDSQVGGQGGLPFAYSAAEQLQMSQMGGDFYPFFQQSMGALEGVMDGIDGMEEQGESVDTGTSEESYEAAMRSMQPMNAAMRDRGDRGEAMGRGAKGPRQAELSERGVDSRSALAAFNQPFI